MPWRAGEGCWLSGGCRRGGSATGCSVHEDGWAVGVAAVGACECSSGRPMAEGIWSERPAKAEGASGGGGASVAPLASGGDSAMSGGCACTDASTGVGGCVEGGSPSGSGSAGESASGGPPGVGRHAAILVSTVCQTSGPIASPCGIPAEDWEEECGECRASGTACGSASGGWEGGRGSVVGGAVAVMEV